MTNAIFECKDELYADWYICEECECSYILDSFKFCPQCGKKINAFLKVKP